MHGTSDGPTGQHCGCLILRPAGAGLMRDQKVADCVESALRHFLTCLARVAHQAQPICIPPRLNIIHEHATDGTGLKACGCGLSHAKLRDRSAGPFALQPRWPSRAARERRGLANAFLGDLATAGQRSDRPAGCFARSSARWQPRELAAGHDPPSPRTQPAGESKSAEGAKERSSAPS